MIIDFRWTIRVRVTYKSEIKEWHNQRGQGRLFNVHFLDETGEIRATGFNDQVDQFYDKLKEGNVFHVIDQPNSGCTSSPNAESTSQKSNSRISITSMN